MYLILVLLAGLLRLSSSSHDSPVASTTMGKLRGLTMTSRGGRLHYAFVGVPYAKPPLNELRFQPPQKGEPWRGIKEAKTFGPFCVQISVSDPEHKVVGEEDCLYLNVFTPNLSGQVPVLVHFHGGGFTMGNNIIYGAQYLIDEGIVIVSVNYRLGIFGFLSFESTELSGNQGMKDQVMALHWVQENIASFGGDPNRVTIIGESAGGASVYHHIVSPLSRGLYSAAVAQSGSSYAPWSLAPPGFARSNAMELLRLLGCPKTTKEAMDCLIKKDMKEIVMQFVEFLVWQSDPPLNFGPVLEPPGSGAFLVGPVSEWNHNPVPLMLGLNSGEGLLRLSVMLIYAGALNLHWYTKNFYTLAPLTFAYFASASKPDEITKKVRNFYLPEKEITMKNLKNLTALYSDSWITIGSIDGANCHKGSVYFYYFDYIMSGNGVFSLPPELRFASLHISEIALLWNLSMPFVANIETEEETKLSYKFIKLVVNFMKHGNPTPEGSEFQWNKWNKNESNYLNIDKTGFHMKKGLLDDRYRFWKSLDYRDKYD